MLQQEFELVEKAKTETEAFSQLYEHYLPKIYGYIYKRVGKQHQAEDLTSQTFLKMVENFARQTFTEGGFKSWLYRIATNTVIDYYRTQKKVEPIDEHLEIRDPESSPAEELSQKENREAVLGVLALLPEKHQQVLHLKFFADLSNVEIAASLGITENHLGVQLHRALQAFQKLYNSDRKRSGSVAI